MNRMTEIEARVGELVAKRRKLLDEIRRLEEIPDPPVPVAARSSPVTARPRPAARAGRRSVELLTRGGDLGPDT